MADQQQEPGKQPIEMKDEDAWRITAMEMDTYWRAIGHSADSGNRIYNILATSLVLLNGGALTVIVTAVGVTPVTAAISGVESLPTTLSWLVKLHSASLIFTILGLVAGRFAIDAAANAVGLNKDAWPIQTYLKEREDQVRQGWNKAAYTCTLLAVATFVIGLIVVSNSA